MPKEVLNTNNGLFINCKYLQNIELSESWKVLRRHTFTNCDSLKKIILPEKMQRLDDMCIVNCKNLEEVVLPNKINVIHNDVIHNCPNLKRITWRDTIYTTQKAINQAIVDSDKGFIGSSIWT